MKFTILIGTFLLAGVLGQGPYPPTGSRPQGPLLILPSEAQARQEYGPPLQARQEYGPPFLARQEYGPPLQQQSSTTEVQQSISLDKLSQEITERLRQQEGAQSGTYYVQLPDGRVQNVRYAASPLRAPPAQNNQQVNVQNSQSFANSNTFQFNQQNAQANSKFQRYKQGPNVQGESRQSFDRQRQDNAGDQYRQSAQSYQPAAANNQLTLQAAGRQVNGYAYNDPAQSSQNGQLTSSSQYNEGAASNQYRESLPGRRPAQQTTHRAKPQSSETPADQPEASSDTETKEATTPAPQVQQDPAQQQQVVQTQLLQQQLVQPQFLQAQILQPQSVQIQHQVEVQQEQWPATYLASIQYTDVQPIAAPIYSYASAPLVRIVRNAPNHQY